MTEGGAPPSDDYWANVAIMFDAGEHSSGSMSTDAKGNSISWHINDNYTWYSVDPTAIVQVAGENALDFKCAGCSQYALYRRRMTLNQPASVNLSGDFTIELFLYLNYGVGDWNRLLVKFGSYSIITNSNAFRIFFDQGGINYYAGNLTSSYFNKILYLAVTRSSGTMKLWLDGVEVASMAGFTVNLSGQAVFGYDGYLDISTGRIFSARVTPGIARTISSAEEMHFPAA